MDQSTKEEAEVYNIMQNSKGVIFNKYPYIKNMTTKDNFKRQMEMAYELNPDAFDFVPRSFVFPEDSKKF